MYMVVNDNLEYYMNATTDNFVSRERGRKFVTLRCAKAVAELCAVNFGEEMAVIDIDNGDKIMCVVSDPSDS